MLYRDTVSVEPGSRPLLDSILVMKDTFTGAGCQSVSRVEKIHFADTIDTFSVSTGFETVWELVSKDTLMCLEQNLVY